MGEPLLTKRIGDKWVPVDDIEPESDPIKSSDGNASDDDSENTFKGEKEMGKFTIKMRRDGKWISVPESQAIKMIIDDLLNNNFNDEILEYHLPFLNEPEMQMKIVKGLLEKCGEKTSIDDLKKLILYKEPEPPCFIHYGSESFDPDRFIPVKNERGWVKPEWGGLWACPIESGKQWTEFVSDTTMDKDISKSFTFRLKEDAKVLEISGPKDLNYIPLCSINIMGDLSQPMFRGNLVNDFKVNLDFEKIAENYDAIIINAGSDVLLYHMFYGWDVDSILVLNKDVVIPV